MNGFSDKSWMQQMSWMLVFLLGFGCAWQLAAAGAEPEHEPTLFEKAAEDLKTGLEYKRIMAIEKLAGINAPEARALMIQTMLHDKGKPVRRAAQRELEGVVDPGITGSIVAGLKDPDRKVRLAAVDVAGLVKTPEMAGELLKTADAWRQDTELVRMVMEALRELVYRLDPPQGFEAGLFPYLESSDRKVRETAVLVLAVVGRPAGLPALMKLWPKADTRLKIDLTDAFANIGWVQPVDLLQQALSAGNRSLRLHAIYALAQIQSFSSLPKLLALLKQDKDPRTRMACLYAAIEIPSPESIPAILDILDTKDPTTLHWATYALSQLRAQNAVPQLLDKLKHPSPMVRATVASALGELKAVQAQPALLAIISNPKEEQEVRLAAARALMQTGNTEGAPVLWDEVQKPRLDTESRLAYAAALGSIAGRGWLDKMTQDLGSSDFSKSFPAALMLGVHGDAAGRRHLIAALDHGYPAIRRYAILGLERIQDNESLKALAATANDDRDALVRILCAASLVRAGYPDFRVLLWNALETRDEDLRSEAIMALGASADADTLVQLKWYLKREPSIPVKQVIQRVLREWKNSE